jgi:hypothetical protein
LTSILKFKSHDDFYKISTKVLKTTFPLPHQSKDFQKAGVDELLAHYKHPYNLLSTFYPQHDWLAWKFDTCPRNFWDSLSNQRKFLDWAKKQLNVKEMNDWYKVEHKVFVGFVFFLM